MKCDDFRLEAEERPIGRVSLSPSLQSHLEGCSSCLNWHSDRERWGDLGNLFREAHLEDRALEADSLILRSRVRTSVKGLARPVPFWRRPVFGALAAGLLLVAVIPAFLSERRPLGPTGPDGLERASSSSAPVAANEIGSEGAIASAAPSAVEGSALRTATNPREEGIGGSESIARDGDVPASDRTGESTSSPTGKKFSTRIGADRSPEADHRPVSRGRREAREAPGAKLARVIRVGNDFGVEWPENGDQVHRVVRSTNPADFTGGSETIVRGTIWVDDSPAEDGASVQYYLID